MTGNVRFECSHDIVIDAPPAAVFDYVTNPASWPEWHPASHHIDSPDRPLAAGETFHERWHIRSGEVRLDWVVTACDPPHRWVAETDTAVIGPIVAQYDFTVVPGGTRYTRTIVNPARAKPPTADMVARIDEEAHTALANIKARVEARRADGGAGALAGGG